MSILSQIAKKLDLKFENNTANSQSVQEKDSKETAVQEAKPTEQTPVKPQNSDSDFVEAGTMKTIISLIKDGVILLDASGKVILVNQAAENITRCKFSEMSGKKLDSLISAKDEAGSTFSIDSFCQRPSNNPIVSLSIKGSDQPVKIELTASAAKDEPTGAECILILHDISAQKMFEQMQIDFVSMASHEFRTPLTSVIGYLEVLSEEVKSKLSNEHKDFLEKALSSSKQLSVLVDNLLNVSKVERGSFAVAIKAIDWEKILNEAIDNTKPQAISKNLILNLHLPDKKLPQVLADEIRIIEVLNNLISNAIAYSKDGGKIDVGIKVTEDEIVTSVQDTGVGIPEEAIAHLFTKFFRVPGALEQNNAGSGLGLYISKSIVDLHKGKIWVESKVGKGSTFYFSLPRADKTQTPTIAKLTINP